MARKIKLGDKVKTLVDKTSNDNVLGKIFCPKGTIVTICDINETYAIVEWIDKNGDENTIEYKIDEIIPIQ